VINTGHVGENKIPPDITKKLILAIVRGKAKWRYDSDLNYEVVVEAQDIDLAPFDPHAVFGEKYSEMMLRLREERRNYIKSNFPEISYLADSL